MKNNKNNAIVAPSNGMYNAIKSFSSQFAYEPKIENAKALRQSGKFIVVGMGGSHLAADLLKIWKPSLDLKIHMNYGLPAVPENILKGVL